MNAQHFGGWVFDALETGSWLAPFVSLLAAFVLSQALAWVYERTYVGLSYSRGFSHTLVLVCVSASILVLAMRHSILAGIGLFGVLSMIRFRTDLKTSRDLVFVMAAAAIGVTTGVDAWVLGSIGTLMLCGISLYLAAGPFGSRRRFDGVLRFNVEPSLENETVVAALLEKFCRRSVLLSTVDIDGGDLAEQMYQVKFFDRDDRVALMDGLRSEARAQEARLMLQDSTSEY